MKKAENYQTSNAEMVTISRAEYEKLQAQSKRISELESRVDLLMEALRLARHKQFGASSEKSEDTLSEQLSFLFNEAEVFVEEKKAEADDVTVVAAHKRHKKHEYTLDSIPEGVETKQVEHRLEGEELVCPECGDTMTEIGKEVVRTLEIIPAQTIVREDIYYTYACKNCSENADEGCETPVVKASREKNIIPGSFATPEAIAHIMTQKFVMGCPLYRQEQEINRKGIHLSRQTMSNWIRTSLLFCTNTSRAEVQNIPKSSWQDTMATSMPTATPDTMIWGKISLLLAVGPMPGENLTRQ